MTRLQRGRAILALSAGQARLAKAGREFAALHRWIVPRLESDPKSFEGWWSRRINAELFAAVDLGSEVLPEQVPGISDLLRERENRIDALEEDYCLRWTSSAALPVS